MSPQFANIRIPIPALYGFGSLPGAVLFSEPVFHCDPPENRTMIPFCQRLSEEVIVDQGRYYTDLREKTGWPVHDMYYLCFGVQVNMMNSWSSRHVGLLTYLGQLLDFLSDSRRHLMDELRSLESLGLVRCGSKELLRIGHIYEGLGCVQNALDIYEYGCMRFVSDPHLHAVKERLIGVVDNS